MKRKGFVALTLALSLTLAPSLTDAKVVESTDTHGDSVSIEALPKAKNKGKEKFDQPAQVEQATTAEVFDKNKNKVGEKKFNKNVDKKAKKNDKKKAQSEEGICILFWCDNDPGGGDDGGGTDPGTTRVVTVFIAADEEYRAAHSDWQTLTQDIVENADNGFQRDHNIDFQVKGLGEWSSQGANASEILQDLDRDWNGTGDDFLVGFTKDSNFNAGGIAYVYPSSPSNSAVSVNLDQGATNTWHAAQHEFSHNYGLGHDPQGSGIECIMNYDYSYSVDYWDQDHDDEIQAHKAWYGN
ncbi:zinc-dependent metalloprotease [Pseudalkalibacillus berkeleyi]|uniref:Zinc-dependent metalloprotease n=1 Tax=Pseudalkalibacillus berkeleyi TaxID=1069813 RepID=A0ABS9H6A7_9BACL|nr:zinc-dependent metalloprotease [Pseudalkalibacillus berkeleyi]MCF6139210.1 zinc-dependent metalloprotease [Pseudalkalibacillus berkeleyi]